MNTASSISIFWQLYTFCPLHITTVDLKSNNHHVTKVQTFSWKVSEINQLMQCFCKTLLINAESLLFSVVVVVVVKLENLCFPTLWTQLDLQLWLSGSDAGFWVPPEKLDDSFICVQNEKQKTNSACRFRDCHRQKKMMKRELYKAQWTDYFLCIFF